MLNHSSPAMAAMIAFAATASAQFVPFYGFSQSVGAYTPISGGTVLATGTGASGAASMDDVTFTVPLPFAFEYDDVLHTTVQIQSNGHIAFGALTTNSFTPLSSAIANAGYIAACAGDLQGGWNFLGTRSLGSPVITGVSNLGPVQVGDFLSGTGIPTGATVVSISGSDITMSANATSSGATTGINAVGPWAEMRWDVQGPQGSRVFIAQWTNFKRFGSTATTTRELRLNFQIRLYEASNTIECVYGNCSPGSSTSTSLLQTGLRGPTNVFEHDLNNRTHVKSANDWPTSIPATTNAQGQLFNSVAPANVIPNGLTYRWVPPPAGSVVASNETFGAGCGGLSDSAYQGFADAAVASAALQGNALQLISTSTGYIGVWLPGAATSWFVTPVAPTVLATGDDGEVNVTPSSAFPTPYGAQSTLRVSGNAVIGFGSTPLTFPGTTAWAPTIAGFLNSNHGGIYAWHDYNESEGGDVQSEEIGSVLYITYNNVESYPDTPTVNPSTLQFQLDLSTGNCTIVWVTVDTDTTSTFGSSHLIGVTPPGNSVDVGAIDLTAGFVTQPLNNPGLALAALNRPVQGSSIQNWNFSATNLPAGWAFEMVGLADPGILDLSPFWGQLNCQLRSNFFPWGVLHAPQISGSHQWSFPIPAYPRVLNGLELFAQLAVFDPFFTFPLTTTTNGIKGTIGNL